MGAEEQAEAAHRDPLVGSVIGGRYRVVGVIGSGAMGTVYDARHEQLDRPVAIKVLSAAWAGEDEAIARFQREARASSRIGHPNIVDVYDLGRLEDGRPYLVMERLDGVSLSDVLTEQTRLPAHRVATLVADIASALDAVHAKGILHRDIKPENIMLAGRDDGTESVKLLDFGLAAFAEPDETSRRLTRQGQVHGTPHYMAPEAGGGELPDHRADVYSLAVVTYELLTGEVPFDHPNPLQILMQKMQHEAPRMQATSGIAFPPELEQVVAKGLACDPQARFDSARDFAQALHRAVEEGTSRTSDPVRPDGPAPSHTHLRTEPKASGLQLALASTKPPPRERALPKRRGPARLLLALAALALVGGAVYGWVRWQRQGASGRGEPARTSSAAAERATTEDPAQSAEPAPLPRGETSPERPFAGSGEAEEDDPELEAQPAHGDEPPAARPHDPRAGPQRRQGRAAKATGPPDGDGAQGGHEPSEEDDRSDGADASDDEQEAPPQLADRDGERAAELASNGTKALVRGRLATAIAHFREATLADARYAPAWRGLGLANERLERAPEARRAYARYLQLAPDAPDAERVRARLEGLKD